VTGGYPGRLRDLLGRTAAHDRLAQRVLPGAGVLLVGPPAVHQQPRVVVHQQEQLGAAAARNARVGHERADEHVTDPAFVGAGGLIAAGHTRRGGQRGA
jgi:hypothetical protein